MQKIARHYWFNKMSMVRRTSINRGKRSSRGSAASSATTGSATSCYIIWPRTVCTNWDLTCRRWAMVSGTGPSTARSSWTARRPSTDWRLAGTRATQEMQWVITTGWSSRHSTMITIVVVAQTVPWCYVAVSGITSVRMPMLTLVTEVAAMALVGINFLQLINSCRQAAAGSCVLDRAVATQLSRYFIAQ